MNSNEVVKIQRFTDLNAWKEAHKLALLVYKETGNFPSQEKYSLVDQMRRAAVSITSNIAEGFTRRSSKEKSQFYSMGQASLTELQNQLILAKDVQYISIDTFQKIANQSVVANKLLNGLLKATKEKRYEF